jgi:hypothetical protein
VLKRTAHLTVRVAERPAKVVAVSGEQKATRRRATPRKAAPRRKAATTKG